MCKKESVRDCVRTKKRAKNLSVCTTGYILFVGVYVCVPVTGTSASCMSREPSQTSLLKPCSSSSNKNLIRFPPSELNSL